MQRFAAQGAILLAWIAVCTLAVLAPGLSFGTPANTSMQPIPARSPVHTGVGSPRSYIDTVDTDGETLTDGTNPVLVPWGGVLEVTCEGLSGSDAVLVCFTMHIDATPDVSDGHLSDGTLDAEGHCMFLVPAKPSNDMRLEVTRFYQQGETYPGAQFDGGACNRAGTAYHLAACSVAGESTDCGAASTCDTGCWNSTATEQCTRRSIDMIAGAWVRMDSVAAETCYFRVDI